MRLVIPACTGRRTEIDIVRTKHCTDCSSRCIQETYITCWSETLNTCRRSEHNLLLTTESYTFKCVHVEDYRRVSVLPCALPSQVEKEPSQVLVIASSPKLNDKRCRQRRLFKLSVCESKYGTFPGRKTILTQK
ncbi:hypothetical protein BaRGS_00017588 [Batillaria attramentaria]|uniref:Uncharacterized protein n=1 Tax=Batillaria attramentaria TaxID=370345 RepID=A0ABD0KVU2_9CAEN